MRLAEVFTGRMVNWDSQPLDAWAARHAEGHMIALPCGQTHYLSKGSGKPVILIHGFFFDSTLWSRNLDDLARFSRVYALDVLGFGYSARTIQPSYELYSRQLAEFMAALGIERATLVGQSLGGGIAIHFSSQHPDKVDRLVLVDSAGLPNPEPLPARLFRLPGVGEVLLNLPTNAIRKRLLRDIFLHSPQAIGAELFERLTRFQKIAGTTAASLALMRRQFADRLEPSLQALARLGLPTLLVWGREDKAIRPDIGQRLHQMLSGSRWEMIGNAGHVPNLEQPEQFNRLLADFLQTAA